MSSPRSAVAIIAGVALAASAPNPVQAQTTSLGADSLLRQVRSLDSSLIVHSHRVDSVRRAVVRSVPPVDVQHGVLHVRTTAELQSRVQVAVDSVSALIERVASPALTARVSAHTPMIVRDSARSIFGMLATISLTSDTLRRWSSITQQQTARGVTAGSIANALSAIVEQFAMQGVDSALGAWVMVGRVPLRPASDAEVNDAYIEITTAESAALRRCRAGETPLCLDVLGIDSLPGTRLTRWYAQEDYRAMLRTVAPSREDSVAVDAWVRCREQHDGASCRVAAVAIGNERVPVPLSPNARLMLLREVLTAGGGGAYERLVTGGGTVRERLARAAGEPIDSTIKRWNARIDASRPERMRVPATLLVASLGWTGALLGLTLVRRGSWS